VAIVFVQTWSATEPEHWNILLGCIIYYMHHNGIYNTIYHGVAWFLSLLRKPSMSAILFLHRRTSSYHFSTSFAARMLSYDLGGSHLFFFNRSFGICFATRNPSGIKHPVTMRTNFFIILNLFFWRYAFLTHLENLYCFFFFYFSWSKSNLLISNTFNKNKFYNSLYSSNLMLF